MTNARWTLSLIEQGSQFDYWDFERVKYNSLAVNTADLVAQLACFTTPKNNKKRKNAEKRLQALNNCYPGIPKPPKSAKSIRNTIHHFDERMDDWLFDEIEKHKRYTYVRDIDGNLEMFSVNGEIGKPFKFVRKMINDNELFYWDKIIKIDELKKWCENIISHFDNIKCNRK